MKSSSLSMTAAVIANDLRASTYQARGALLLLGNLAFVSLAGVCAMGSVIESGAQDPGTVVLQLMGLTQLLVLLVSVPWWTSDMLRRERHRGTWDLVVLSRISYASLVSGKYVAALGSVCVLLIVALPAFILTSLYGTVSAVDVASVYIVLVLTAILLCGVGLLASTLRRPQQRKALLATPSLLAVVLFPVTVALPASADLLANPLTVREPLAWLSPTAALLSTVPGGATQPASGFPLWSGYALVCLVLGGLGLWLSARRLRREWERPRERDL